jgi:anaerobic magnesium-protoporphyrin IX monomethyl ester cyclase
MRWYTEMGRRVWLYEIRNFFLRDRRTRRGPTVQEFWGNPQDGEERSMTAGAPGRRPPAEVATV